MTIVSLQFSILYTSIALSKNGSRNPNGLSLAVWPCCCLWMNCKEKYVDLLEGMFLRTNCKQEKWTCRQFQPLSKILVLWTLVWNKINPWRVKGILIKRKHLETRAKDKPRLEKAGKNPSLPKFQFMKFQKWHTKRLCKDLQLSKPFFALFMSRTKRIV